MPFPTAAKRSGLDVMIEVGKPKPKPDLDAPSPVDEPKKPKMPEAAPAEPVGDYSKLDGEIAAALEPFGLDATTSKRAAVAVLSAALKCLSEDEGDGEEASEPEPETYGE